MKIAYTVKKIPRLLDAILDLSGIENGYIWNSIHFAFDGGFSLLRLDVPNSIQLYPKRNREKYGIPSNRDRIKCWIEIQIVPFYSPNRSKKSPRKGTDIPSMIERGNKLG